MKKIIKRILKESKEDKLVEMYVNLLLDNTMVHGIGDYVYVRFPWDHRNYKFPPSIHKGIWVDSKTISSFAHNLFPLIEEKFGIDDTNPIADKIIFLWTDIVKRQIMELENDGGFDIGARWVNESVDNRDKFLNLIVDDIISQTGFEVTSYGEHLVQLVGLLNFTHEWFSIEAMKEILRDMLNRDYDKLYMYGYFKHAIQKVYGNLDEEFLYDIYVEYLKRVIDIMEEKSRQNINEDITGIDVTEIEVLNNKYYRKIIEFLVSETRYVIDKYDLSDTHGNFALTYAICPWNEKEWRKIDGSTLMGYESFMKQRFNIINGKVLLAIALEYGKIINKELERLQDETIRQMDEEDEDEGMVTESKDVSFGVMEELYDSVMGDLMNRTHIKQNNRRGFSVFLDGKQIFKDVSKKRLKEKGDKIKSPEFDKLCKIYNINNKNKDILWKKYISNILYNVGRVDRGL